MVNVLGRAVSQVDQGRVDGAGVHELPWWRALHLDERRGCKLTENVSDLARVRRWMSLPPFTDPTVLEKRLQSDRLTASEFEQIVSGEAQPTRAPQWWRTLQEALCEPVESSDIAPTPGFVNALLAPLLSHSIKRLRVFLGETFSAGDLMVLDAVESGLLDDLTAVLGNIVSKTFALELNVARITGCLHGSTSNERYNDFLTALERCDRGRILSEYPVLARYAVEACDRWIESSIELLTHFRDDVHVLQRDLRLPAGELLQSISRPKGDPHRRGRCVRILTFANGQRVVYKPRPIAVEAHFNALLQWLNEQGFTPKQKVLCVLDRGRHGWVEYVRHSPCPSLATLPTFYRRLGGLLTLLHVLDATDIHFENIIASGEYPVLIDLEALFQPLIGQPRLRPTEKPLTDSVLRVGMLPFRTVFHGDRSVRTSGLGSPKGALSDRPAQKWECQGTDEMRLVRKSVPMAGGPNVPYVSDCEAPNVLDFLDDTITGFQSAYEIILRNKGALTDPAGLLHSFANDEIRVVARSTATYAALAGEMFHPDLLRDALEQDMLLDRLWIMAARRPELVSAVPHELHDLRNGDIPLFTTTPSDIRPVTSVGTQLEQWWECSGIERATRRIAAMSASGLERQIWLIIAAFTAFATSDYSRMRRSIVTQTRQDSSDDEEALSIAIAIGDRLQQLAYHDHGHPGWFGLNAIVETKWVPRPIGHDLYAGLAGITLFLGYLGSVTGTDDYSQLARRTFSGWRSSILKNESPPIGAFNGLAGSIYTLFHLGALWTDAECFALADSLAGELDRHLDSDTKGLDIINGAAGCITALLADPRRRGNSVPHLDLAIRCGDHLLAHAIPWGDGIGWLTTHPTPLASFAHGSAGIAWALIRLYEACELQKFKTAAIDTVLGERQLYRESIGNWIDARNNPELSESKQMCSWCHGAAGIALSRAELVKHVDDERLRAELGVALNTTLRTGIGTNHSLCHGALGNLQCLTLSVATSPKRDELHHAVAQLQNDVFRDIRRGILCGVVMGIDSPGLMNGLSGVGLALLRFVAPDRVPSPLTLERPAV
jgi:type 2 lantibiotic biosynthesis protein LanM